MKPGLPRTLLVQAIRYLAASQGGPAVILHASWMLLALGVWQQAHGGAAPDDVSRLLVRAFMRLGGTDAQGVGSGESLLVVWGKLSVLLYLIEAAARAVFGPRKPMRLGRMALLSGGVAFVGFGGAFLAADGNSGAMGLLMLAGLFALLAAGAVVWAVMVRRAGDGLVRMVEA